MGQNGSKPKPRPSRSNSAVEAAVGRIAVSGRYHWLPHTIADDYHVLNRVLGTGFNGVVKQAVAKGSTSAVKYAVKAFTTVNLSKAAKAQLETEVDIFLGMDHPHVARLFDVYESEHHLHLVMECMEGKELFERITQQKRFDEHDAAQAVMQILLAVNYLHSNAIVHRDLKLENFLYDKVGSEHLKLIDFGFSKVSDPNVKMQCSCGTLSYVAPEVLQRNYTNKCDIWSVGVIAFILLAGYMPFAGTDNAQASNILAGNYNLKPDRWNHISEEGLDFVKSLLTMEVDKRPSASQALADPWIMKREAKRQIEIDEGIVDALRQFGQASRFRRACLGMMAWSLSNDEVSLVREQFLAMDKNKEGTITLGELKQVLTDKFNISNEETLKVFEVMDSNQDQTIHYSDFLAAMLSSRIQLHGDLLKKTFQRFDKDSSGFITLENLKEVLGESYEGANAATLLAEADLLQDGRISYKEFEAYLRKEPLDDAIQKKRSSEKQVRMKSDPTLFLGQVSVNLKESLSWANSPSKPFMTMSGVENGKKNSLTLAGAKATNQRKPVVTESDTVGQSAPCCTLM